MEHREKKSRAQSIRTEIKPIQLHVSKRSQALRLSAASCEEIPDHAGGVRSILLRIEIDMGGACFATDA